jgi:hypothetical protein
MPSGLAVNFGGFANWWNFCKSQIPFISCEVIRSSLAIASQ